MTINEINIMSFKREVSDRAHEIDPNNEQDWFSLTLGWAIARGFSPEAAHEFASFIRYKTDLG
jgi:hypothetical protein